MLQVLAWNHWSLGVPESYYEGLADMVAAGRSCQATYKRRPSAPARCCAARPGGNPGRVGAVSYWRRRRSRRQPWGAAGQRGRRDGRGSSPGDLIIAFLAVLLIYNAYKTLRKGAGAGIVSLLHVCDSDFAKGRAERVAPGASDEATCERRPETAKSRGRPRSGT